MQHPGGFDNPAECSVPAPQRAFALSTSLFFFFSFTGLSAGFGVLASQGDQPKKGEKKFFPAPCCQGSRQSRDLGPELSPRKSGRFVRATPCQCREVTRFPPSDAQNRGRCEGGRVNHKPQGVSDF